MDEFAELFECCGVGGVGGGHEAAGLEMDADDVGAELLHFFEVLGDGVEFIVPVVFDEAACMVVVVIETPDTEWFVIRVSDEVLAVGCDFDTWEFGWWGGLFGGGWFWEEGEQEE